MSEAIALSSPSGRMSKRAREVAHQRLGEALFGPGGLPRPALPTQPSEKDRLLLRAAMLRDLAARGMRPRAHVREAAALEAKAKELP